MKTIDIDSATEILKNGGVVAIPTETVYGLGGWIYSEEGLQKIFATKERPFFDPLIVHVDSLEKARKLSSKWTDVHEILAKNCWPGPLTLIAKKNDEVNPLITAGLDSVGIRFPNHPLTLKLLQNLPGGVAAPSANKFKKTSPTTPEHVFGEFGESVPILEGGQSDIGIESTVLGVHDDRIEIFRPGFYTASMISEILRKNGVNLPVSYAESPVAPGQLKHHYMPKTPLIIVPEGFDDLKKINELLHKETLKVAYWKQPKSSALASRELYQKMREFDQAGFDVILAERNQDYKEENWLGIWNRLSKAKTFDLT